MLYINRLSLIISIIMTMCAALAACSTEPRFDQEPLRSDAEIVQASDKVVQEDNLSTRTITDQFTDELTFELSQKGTFQELRSNLPTEYEFKLTCGMNPEFEKMIDPGKTKVRISFFDSYGSTIKMESVHIRLNGSDIINLNQGEIFDQRGRVYQLRYVDLIALSSGKDRAKFLGVNDGLSSLQGEQDKGIEGVFGRFEYQEPVDRADAVRTGKRLFLEAMTPKLVRVRGLLQQQSFDFTVDLKGEKYDAFMRQCMFHLGDYLSPEQTRFEFGQAMVRMARDRCEGEKDVKAKAIICRAYEDVRRTVQETLQED